MRFDPVQGGGAQRLHMIRESFIREMTRLAITHNAINLSQGFPDFDPPREAIEAAHAALESGGNQYTITWGTLPLREAIAAKMQRWYGLNFDPNRAHHGHVRGYRGHSRHIDGDSQQGRRGHHYRTVSRGISSRRYILGRHTAVCDARSPDYALDLDRLRDAFNERTKAIIVNTPHNPTGRIFTRPEMEGIAELCQEFNVVAITDEIYEHITYDGHLHFPLATIPGMAERTVTISGLGKTFAMTGWRLGYACALNPLSTILRTVHDFMTICAPAPLQAACAAVLNLPDEYYVNLKTDYTQRRAKMMSIIERAGFSASPIQGSYYVMADFSNWDFDGDDYSFARWLPANLGVAVVPGSCFYGTKGMGKKIVRFAFAKKLETLAAAEERLCSK